MLLAVVLFIIGAVFIIVGGGAMISAAPITTSHTGRVVKPFVGGRAFLGLVAAAVGAIIVAVGTSVAGWL